MADEALFEIDSGPRSTASGERGRAKAAAPIENTSADT
jgi:hypothetical protein